MFYSVTGVLRHTEPNFAVIDCGGVGFQCMTTTYTLSKLPPVGKTATLYTYLNVREDALILFGFGDQEELHCFKLLISVTGVGPKAALAILSELSPARFALSVAAGDSKSITRAQGVGNKTAQRIVLELKDKLSANLTAGEDEFAPAPAADACRQCFRGGGGFDGAGFFRAPGFRRSGEARQRLAGGGAHTPGAALFGQRMTKNTLRLGKGIGPNAGRY